MDISSLRIVLSVHAVALISPGPDFAVTTRLSVLNGRKAGVLAASGIATAIGIYVMICAFGLSLVLSALPVLSRLLAYAGALYLGWLGVKSLLSQGESPTQAVQTETGNAFATGFFTNLLNPKAMVYFSSVLPQVLKPHAPLSDTIVILLLLCLESLLWFAIVAFVFSSNRVFVWLNGRLVCFKRIIGAVLIALAFNVARSIYR
ncbi:lysine transporter LysE [candidate division KSB3 bacterium]|uniref:Lysine transporter LysE n=1 Tax=candidate division KSB3 bacterium TaxID=2044937 RepID=A0A2G6EA15_9BACT|nr:MAG: lysine transporter LysE [candidate division KSB3 bacterium]PIE30981.1 MAG: lysine transporter LysE [candidate division KSB3 bacterium]